MGLIRNIKQLLAWLPEINKYISVAKICIHYATLAKKDIETIFDDIDGNEPIYLNE